MKEFQPFIYKENDPEEDYEWYYALYAGKGLNKKYPDDHNIWLWLEYVNLWERHAIEDISSLEAPSKNDFREIIQCIFRTKKWQIAT